jgi:hypothetical protein
MAHCLSLVAHSVSQPPTKVDYLDMLWVLAQVVSHQHEN